jgi:hypothetical protein
MRPHRIPADGLGADDLGVGLCAARPNKAAVAGIKALEADFAPAQVFADLPGSDTKLRERVWLCLKNREDGAIRPCRVEEKG